MARRRREVLRLTVKERSPEEAVLAVDGWVSGEEVGLLAQEGARWLSQARRLVLDLRQLRGIDEAGIDLLKTWRTERLTLCNGSPFVTALLEAHGLEVSNRPP
jgi:ABC-type transporter Mla MlaB component